VTADIVLECPTKDEISALTGATEEEAQKLIFGEHYEDAMALFGGKSMFIWNAFMERYNLHFFGDANAGK